MEKGVTQRYRRAWRLFDYGLITHEELLDMIEAARKPIQNVKGI